MFSLFGVQGRTGRLGYWRVQLLCAVCLAVVWMLGLFAMLGLGPIGSVLFAPIPVIVVISVATWFRRLHDRGKGLWWAFLFSAGPWVCLAVARGLASIGATALVITSLPFSLGALGLTVWGLVEVGFLRGQPGPNRFGDPPAVGR
jgi:uncharacterized membrane protein YhaH (DUF805 family)